MLFFLSPLWKNPIPRIKGRIVRRRFWLSELPVELLVHIMTFLGRKNLETLISTLEMDFTGVVRYVVDTPSAVRSSKVRTVKLGSLDHDTKKSMINIVVIKNANKLDTDLIMRYVTGSFNLFCISNVKVHMEYPLVLRENILEKLLIANGACNRATALEVTNSDELEVRHRDVTQTAFSNINNLVFMFCKVGEGSLHFITSNVKVIRLFWCSGRIIHPKTFRLADGMRQDSILRDISINACEVRIIGSHVRSLIFNGTVLRHFSPKKNTETLALTKVRAPKLIELNIRFYKFFPIVMDFYAPLLTNVKIFKRPEETESLTFNNDTQDTPNRYHFLRSITTLELRFFCEPLYKVEFTWLCTLTLHLHKNLVPLQNDFPRLDSFNVHLLEEVDMVPIIRAKNLYCLNLFYYKNLTVWTFSRARSSYPHLLRFSLRHRVWNYFD
jgi:hypothetical protein